MLGVERGTAEEFFSRCLANAQVLDAAARRHTADADVVRAVAAAWGADVNTLQAVMWERILVASSAPQRQYFQVAETVVEGLGGLTLDDSEGLPSLVMAAAREAAEASFEEPLAEELRSRWPDVGFLDAVGPFTAAALEESLAARLQGLSPAAFVGLRRRAAGQAMLEAQARRIRSDIGGAIQSAYEGDFLGLEGYLVESAVAAGDLWLLTAVVRWDLAIDAVSGLAGLPDDFAAAVGTIRAALTSSLGEADGTRLLASLPRI